MGRNKKQFPDLLVERMHHSGHGYAESEGRPLLVEEGLPGDRVDGVERRKKKGLLHLRIDALLEEGIPRVEPFCAHFDLCGGCTLQHLAYADQLRLKEGIVESSMREYLQLPEGEDPRREEILPCERDRLYRNKLEFSFSTGRWLTEEETVRQDEISDRRALGFHVPGRFDRVVEVTECHLQPEPSNRIRNGLREFTIEGGYSYYDPKEHHGLLRLLMIRTGLSGEVQVTVMFGEDQPEAREEILSFLLRSYPEIASLYYLVNSSRNDSFAGLRPVHHAGAPYITEGCGKLRFRIYPTSFYQTNPIQAVRLYDVAKEYAALTGGETVYDLYSGLGSIALYLAEGAAKVVGIETVEEAVASARENAAVNGIDNVTFYQGEVESLLDRRFIADQGAPDCVILDPPRPGVHERALRVLLDARPPRIVYVSCNPLTQARDLAILQEGYEIRRMRGVDMFPQTRHVEQVVALTLRG
ncbi:MAG: 23S rRNA (uracil(1939)-C(5))-methyltransferase RlmD [Alkalispirochaetaceae bacterium]